MTELTNEEWEAVYDWINREMDRLPSPLKEGILKLVNEEQHRRVFVPGAGDPGKPPKGFDRDGGSKGA